MVRDMIDPYLDGELPAEDARALENHLKTCRHCAFESTQLLRMKEVIKRWHGISPSKMISEEVLSKVRGEIASHGTPQQRYIRRLMLTIVGSVLATAGALVIVFYTASHWKLGVTTPVQGTTNNDPLTSTGRFPAVSFAKVTSISGDDVKVIGRSGQIYRPQAEQDIVPGESVEVGETSLLGVDVAGGRILIGCIAWRGQQPSEGLKGPTRLKFASSEAGIDIARGALRVSAVGEGVGDIRFHTQFGTVYVPWTGADNETAEASIFVSQNSTTISVTSGEAGILVTHNDGSTQNISVKKGNIVEVGAEGEIVKKKP